MRNERASVYDAVVIGSGPNGLSAAIELARAELSVLVLEARSKPGGGARTDALTLPGYQHDTCSTVYPLAVASPFFRSLALEKHGLTWRESPCPLAHVIDPNTVVTLERSILATAVQLGRDEDAYLELLSPIVDNYASLLDMVLGPLRWPTAPVALARFGLSALASMKSLSARYFRDRAAPALMAGMAAHSMLRLDAAASASFALILAAAGHSVGWPIAVGGSQAITTALVDCLYAFGGTLECDHEVRSISDLPPARVYVFDLSPKQLLDIVGDMLPRSYCERLRRFRYGPGVFKIDWALRAPIPWRNPACLRACTIHLAGEFERVSAAEASVNAGKIASEPFVLVVQPSLFDILRAPVGGHTAWAYCHVPNGSREDLAERIEARIEQYAPGFRSVIEARATKNTEALQAYNPNYIGGDINGGMANLGQLFFRPIAQRDPYCTPAHNIYLCSSSTPPGGGVHGMCGYWAARSVLRRSFGRSMLHRGG